VESGKIRKEEIQRRPPAFGPPSPSTVDLKWDRIYVKDSSGLQDCTDKAKESEEVRKDLRVGELD